MGRKRNVDSEEDVESVYTPILPLLVVEVTKEWADERALGLPSMYAEGQSLAEVCRDLGISKDQYREACKVSDDFAAADRYAQVVSEAWWHKTGRDGANGRRINGSVWAANMNNRYGWSNSGGDSKDAIGNKTLNIGVVFMGNRDDTQIRDDISSVIDMTNRLTVVKSEDEI